MNKGDLINEVAKVVSTKKEAQEAVDRKARKGRNPQTGEEIDIKASKAPKFSPGKALKEAVN